MRDPVLCEDGHTYERTVILQWLATSPTSPTTRQPMSPTNLRPNYALKAAIERWSTLRQPPPTQPLLTPPSIVYQPQTYAGYVEIPVAPIPTQFEPIHHRSRRRHVIPCLMYLIIIGVVIYMWHEGMFG